VRLTDRGEAPPDDGVPPADADPDLDEEYG
jgi:hypothetical protein